MPRPSGPSDSVKPYAVSALHGRGSGDLLDAVLDALPATPSEFAARGVGPRRVALLGKPNVGKVVYC